ncbi:MAG: hypothetical protein AAB383_04085 [Patescibacteria group bacterium]
MGPDEELKKSETELSPFSPEVSPELSGERASIRTAVRARAFVFPEGVDETNYPQAYVYPEGANESTAMRPRKVRGRGRGFVFPEGMDEKDALRIRRKLFPGA